MFGRKFNPVEIRKEFPCLDGGFLKKPPIYFDNACMTLKPKRVIDAISKYYSEHPSCHNRALHTFGELTTKKVNHSREMLAKFIGAQDHRSIVFTKNTTESINMIAQMMDFQKGDVVLTSELEHNSNMLPWQFLQFKKGIVVKRVSVRPDDEEFDLHSYEKILAENKVKLVSLLHISNITGMKYPIEEATRIAKKYGALVLIDAAQSISQVELDVSKLDCDFLAFSIHKMYGPTGLGILYGKLNRLDAFTPYHVGGEGVVDTFYDSCTLSAIPEKFEVGLQDYAGIIGSSEAVAFLNGIDFVKGSQFKDQLIEFALSELRNIPNLRIIGPKLAKNRNGNLNIEISGRDVAEISMLLDKSEKVMTRSGVHCGHAWYHHYNLKPSLRLSLGFYNTMEEVNIFIEILRKVLGSSR